MYVSKYNVDHPLTW